MASGHRATALKTEDGDFYVSKPAPVFSVQFIDTSNLFAEFAILWESSVFSDFTVECEGRSFQVHRAIVTANSSYFKRELSACYHNGDTVKSLEVEADPDLLHLLLCFLYRGQLDDVLIEQAEALGELADHLGVPQLSKQCQQAYLSHLTPTVNNCLSAWSKALSVQDRQMASKFERLALTNFPTLKDESSFLSLPFSAVMVYLSHKDLCVQDPDDRLTFAMMWLRHDLAHRIDSFPALLKSLPLEDMGRGFLKFFRTDGALRGKPDIQDILQAAVVSSKPEPENVSAAAMLPPKPQPEPSSSQLETNVGTAVMWIDENNISVYPASFDKPVTVITPPNTKRYLGRAACCSDGTDLYVSGLGDDLTEMHCCDVQTRDWRRMKPLNYGRKYHSMVVSGGKVLVLGGEDTTRALVHEVEEVELPGGAVREEGRLHGSKHYTTCCCRHDDTHVIVMGHWDESNRALIQIYSASSSNTTHVMKLPDDVSHAIKGVECVNETLVFATDEHVFTCPIMDVYNKVSTGVQKLSHFSLPDSSCMLTLSTDNQQVLLLGGYAQHRVYQASVGNLMADSTRGWSPVKVQWDEEYCAYPGAVCRVRLPVAYSDHQLYSLN